MKIGRPTKKSGRYRASLSLWILPQSPSTADHMERVEQQLERIALALEKQGGPGVVFGKSVAADRLCL